MRTELEVLLYNTPAASVLTKYKTSGLGGLSKTKNSLAMQLPSLASASTHLFPSLNTCTTRVWRNLLSKYLQSLRRGRYGLLAPPVEVMRLTTTLASNSTTNFWTPMPKASFNPSLSAQNSTTKLEACPMDLENPLIHFPLQSLIKPPPPALPGFPLEAPSVFNLNHCSSGLLYFTGMKINCFFLPDLAI